MGKPLNFRTYSFITICLLGSIGLLQGQKNFNLELVSNFDYAQLVADVWGYVGPDGTEYAIVGTFTGTSFISLKDPSNPEEVLFIPGAQSIWRDMHNWGDYVYAVADRGEDGLLIVDMSNAPDSMPFKFWRPQIELSAEINMLNRCHNLWIDEKGYGYLSGCNLNRGGVLIIDLHSDPWNPTFLSAAADYYSHDNYTRDDIMFSADIVDGFFSIHDVSDRTNPILLNTQTTTSQFTHACWLSDDGRYLFTTDERPNSFVDAYDVTDPLDIKYISSFRPKTTEGLGVIPHNVHYYNGFLVVSWYTDGIVVIDAHRPENMVKVGQYDTWPGAHGGFNGAWGAYPYLPSGLVLGSDRQSGLYVFEPNYVRASYLEGRVTSSVDGQSIPGVEVEILVEVPTNTATNPSGNYKTGSASEGIQEVVFSHPQYHDLSVEVELIRGVITELNVELTPNNLFFLEGTILEESTQSPIQEAIIEFDRTSNPETIERGLTDLSGNFKLLLQPDTLNISFGKWGYSREHLLNFEFLENSFLNIELNKGYSDDFHMDLSWEVSSTTSAGQWQRAIPAGSISEGQIVHPDADVPDDFGKKAFVTGQPIDGNPFSDFPESGSTILLSPVINRSDFDFSPVLSFSYWLFNETNHSDNYFKVYLEGDNGEVLLLEFNETTQGWTRVENLSLFDAMERIGSRIRLRFEVKNSSNNLVVGGLDNLIIEDNFLSTTEHLASSYVWNFYPNPANDHITIVLSNDFLLEKPFVEIFDSGGKRAFKGQIGSRSETFNIGHLPSGIYLINLLTKSGQRVESKQFIIKK
ncbi:MAG: choice-of-anchor B family protein [Saprospirales bacterium]|nr:MAG: choice-of-anchor B family protein [Saprospirales bacterium]